MSDRANKEEAMKGKYPVGATWKGTDKYGSRATIWLDRREKPLIFGNGNIVILMGPRRGMPLIGVRHIGVARISCRYIAECEE